jgi:Family of unknown function (DUF5906)
MTSPIEVTILRKDRGIISKRISLVDGKVASDGSACGIGHGRAERRHVDGLAGFAELIGGLKPNEAITLGVLRADLADDVAIVTKDEVPANATEFVAARSGDYIVYRDGEPAFVLFDHDTKDMPGHVARRIEELGGFRAALLSTLPGLVGTGHVLRASTSSGLSNADTGATYPASAGKHDYVEAEDGTDAVRFLQAVHDRAWLAGFGWYGLGKDGKLLERSLVDRMVGRPERIQFEGAPEVVPPLRQDAAKRRPEFSPGGRVDTRAVCPPLSPTELQAKAALLAADKRRIEPERKRVRDAYVDEKVGERRARGMTLQEARAAVAKMIDGGVLTPDVILPFDSFNEEETLTGTGVTVENVLDAPEAYAWRTLADPIEGVEYGRGKATIMIGDDGLPFINSFAHGGRVFRLRYDARTIERRVADAADKVEAFVKMMLAADVDAVEEERLVKKVSELTEDSVDAIEEKLSGARAEAGERARELMIDAINERHAFVLAGNKAAVMKFEDDGRQFRLIGVDAFKLWHANKAVARDASPAGAWLTSRRRREYEGIEFAPAGGRPGYYNLWQGFAVEPRPGNCGKFLAHIRDNVAQGNTFLYNWIVGYFAQIAQQPDKKLGTALALRGKPGVGKTKVGEVFGSLFRSHYALVADSRYVTGQFNSHMASLLLLHADEAFWAGDKRSEGKLKDLVTGSTHFLEFKGVNPIEVRNLIRLFVTGNSDWLVPAAFRERRWAVVDVGEAHIQDHAYFAAIDEDMNNGGREALLHHLLAFDLKSVNLRAIPETAALLDQKIESATAEEKFWFDTLKSGRLPGARETEPRACRKSKLYEAYLRHAGRTGVHRRSIEVKVGMFLVDHVPGLVTDQKVTFSFYNPRNDKLTKRAPAYKFPPLADCRAAFARKINQAVNWGTDVAEWQADELVDIELSPDEDDERM